MIFHSDDEIGEMIEQRARAIMQQTKCTRDHALDHATAITSAVLVGDLLGMHIREGIDAAVKRVTEKEQS